MTFTYQTTPEQVFELIQCIAANNVIDGFTLTGGDPIYQPEDLRVLIRLLRGISKDVLVYTGYRIEDLSEDLLQGITVLIDGEYIENRNTNCVLRGSDNQRIYILDDEYTEKYEAYLSSTSNQIQNFMTSNGIISVGIHKPQFMDELDDELLKKGLM